MRNRFETLHTVMHVVGSLFIILGLILLIPLAMVIFGGELRYGINTCSGFLLAILVALVLGYALKTLFRGSNPNTIQAMLICSLAWLCFSAIGAIPFVLGINASFLDGFFETMSGFTTTGITMFSGLDRMPASIIFWRALTQWIGGLGILTFFLAVTYHGTGGHRLFGAESHKIDQPRLVPGLERTVKILWLIYTGISLVLIAALCLAGMSLFDSICHCFTAVSTGGFSPYDASIGHYRAAGYAGYKWIEYILIVGMVLGGTNFLIHYRLIKGSWKALFDNTEMRYWWGLIAFFVIIIFIERGLQAPAAGSETLETRFRTVLFQVTSILTTTGFGTEDIGSPWFGHAARQLFLIMMVIGGCVGSTGGGIKVLRIGILVKMVKREIRRAIFPAQSVTTIMLDDQPVNPDELQRIASLFFAWIGLLAFGGLVTALLSDLDGYQSFSGMFSALGNIGPCYISVEAMSQLHPFTKIVYILGMLAGRLEILPVLILFTPKSWKF